MEHISAAGTAPTLDRSTAGRTPRGRAAEAKRLRHRRLALVLPLAMGALCLALLLSSLASAVTVRAAGPPIRYVAQAPAGSDAGNDCTNRFTPCATIQHAVSVADAGDEVRVAAGTYIGTVTINKNLTLRGGFSTANWFTPDPQGNATIIDAQGSATTPRRVIYVPTSVVATVSGFHLTGGETSNANGAGVHNLGNLTLVECHVYDNEAGFGSNGGGVSNGNVSAAATLVLRDSRVYSNVALLYGGGLHVVSGTVLVEAAEIFDNAADSAGGVVVLGGDVTIRSTLLYSNTADSSGGGIAVSTGTVRLENDTLFDNAAAILGGGIYAYSGELQVTNGLIVSNTAALGGGVYSSTSGLSVAFTDFFGNSPEHVRDVGGIIDPPTLDSSNRVTNPLFIDPQGFDLHLTSSSPAIDAGTSADAPSVDFEGEGRPFGTGIDRGGDEYTAPGTCFARLDGGRVYPDVQDAIDAASNESVIQVAGTCSGVHTRGGSAQTAYVSRTLTLQGGYSSTDWSRQHYGPTVLDAQGSGRAIYITGTTAIAPRIEDFHLTGGAANLGAGVYVGPNVAATLVNNVVAGNAASYGGGGICNDEGSTDLQHNTIYSNTAQFGGGVYARGVVTLASSAVIDNRASSGGGGIFASGDGSFALNYNNLYGNSSENYGGTVTTGTTDMSVLPGFVDPGSADFHLDYLASAMANRADPASTVGTDFEGDARPQGPRADVGADESWLYAAVALGDAPESPLVIEDTALIEGTLVTFTHAITNLGNTAAPTDTFFIDASNNDGWDVTLVGISSPLTLSSGDSVAFSVVVSVPVGVPETVFDVTTITATSVTNGAVRDATEDVITTPGVQLFPNHTENADPGEVVTYTHTLVNTGIGEDTFEILLNSPLGWGELLEPPPTISTTHSANATITLGPGESAPVVARAHVPANAPAGLADVMTIRATSDYSVAIFDVVTDTTIANPTSGDRFVATSGSDVYNNCTQPSSPCATIGYAINQAAWGDGVLVAQGTYPEANISINQDLRLQGGYEFNGTTFSLPGGAVDPTTTIIDAQNGGRGLRIETPPTLHPLVEGFTIRNAAISGFGGAIWVRATSAPTLTHLIIENSTATRGGGIYVDAGDPVLSDVTILGTSASSEGGGIFVDSGSPIITSVTISGTAATNGAGLYNQSGTLTALDVWISDGAASDAGGGIYSAGGALSVLQGRIVRNTASNGGGVYGAGGSLILWNNFLFDNAATSGSGGGIFEASGTLDLINNTLVGNQASDSGGGLFDAASSSLVVSNTLFAENTASSGGGIYRISAGSLRIDYNDLWNNSAASFPESNVPVGPHSISADPLFADAAAGDLHITPDSPCMDSGDPSTFLTVDIDGDLRPVNQGYDIGADELAGCLARVVNPSTFDQVGPLYGVLQEAVDAAPESYVVQVAGVCRGVLPREVDGQVISQTVLISKSLTLEGGYESGFGAPGSGSGETLLDAEGVGRVLVVTGPVYVEVSHLRLANGNAAGLGGGPGGGGAGGGVYNDGDTLYIRESVITDSLATYGGGIYHVAGTLVVTGGTHVSQTQIVHNVATAGGGLYLEGGSPALQHATVADNSAQLGGGLYNTAGSAAVEGATFVRNDATSGGAVYNAGGSLLAEETWFAHNSASDGGALYNGGGLLTVQRSVVISNTASSDGGGLSNDNGADLVVVNTIAAYNSAGGDGGGLANSSGNLTLRHDTFYANDAAGQGGGIYHHSNSGLPVINSTLIVGNGAGSGGGIYSGAVDPQFDYNDVTGNSGGDYGGNLLATDGTGNISADPAFVSTDPASERFLRIPPGSPAEEVGDPDSPILVDIDGEPRPSNQGFDIGADEMGGCYIRINGQPPTYGNVQIAIDAASAGDALHVAGTCLGVNPALDGGQTVTQTAFVDRSLSIQGGYTTTNWVDPDPAANPTAFDALGMGRLVYVTNSSAISITGLHLRQGSAVDGAAIFVKNGVLTLTHSLVYSNTATGSGGALYNAAGDVFLSGDDELFANSATNGGAVYNAGGQLTLEDGHLHDNEATTSGGAVYHAGGGALLQNDVIQGNHAATHGGGIYCSGTGLTVRHNTLVANSATDGGGLYSTNASPAVVNNVFFNNTATSSGHAIYCVASYAPDYNDAYPAANAYSVNVSPGPNSLSVDPLFVNAAGGNFHLQVGSPVVDRGDPSMTLWVDFDGDLRPGDQGFDMGADELLSCYARIERTGVVYGNLQSAVDSSIAGDLIQVSQGVCRGVHPYDVGGRIVSQTVHFVHDLTLVGGFNRDFTGGGNSGPGVYPDPLATTIDPIGLGRAVLITDSAVITMERFITVHGDATGLGGGPGGGDAGGGFYHAGDGIRLAHVDCYSSTADYGGAFYSAGDGFDVYNSWLHYNTANVDGGAIYNASGTMTITGYFEGTRIISNAAAGAGGGIYNDAGLVWVLDNNYENAYGGIIDNVAAQGGAIANHGGEMVVTGNDIEENVATQQGGAVYNEAGTLTLENNDIHANAVLGSSAGHGGGGLHVVSGTVTLDLGNRFHENSSNSDGGAIYVGGGSVEVWNSLIYSNTTVDSGAGIYVAGGSPSILHNTLVQNQSTSGTGYGGGICVASGTPLVKNNIFDSNSCGNPSLCGTAIYANAGTLGFNDYWPGDAASQVRGTVATGSGNLNADPLFEDAASGDFHLQITSPLIHQAEDGLGVMRDFEDDPRPVNAGPDIGADEVNFCLARVASTGQTYGRIQLALDDASPGDTILVAEGICEESITIEQDVTLSGSWEKDFSEQLDVIATTVDALGQARVVTVTYGVGSASLSWLTLIGGDAAGGDGGGIWNGGDHLALSTVGIVSNTATNGGGIYIDTGSATLFEALIEGNTATASGGGIYAGDGVTLTQDTVAIGDNEALTGNGGGIYVGSSGRLDDIEGAISNNHAGTNGGGVYLAAGSRALFGGGGPIDYNQADNGGGIYTAGGTLTLEKKQVNSNDATAGDGGGVFAGAGSNLSMTNPGFYGNTAFFDGGGIYRSSATGSAVLYHATLHENSALNGHGGGVYNLDSSMVISASIVASNTASLGGSGVYGDSNVTIAYTLRWANDYSGVSSHPTNLVGNPHFRPDEWGIGGDLLYTSAAIDTVPLAASHVEIDRFDQSRIPADQTAEPTSICFKDMGRDEFVVLRQMGWLPNTPTPSMAIPAPGESVTYTFYLQNQSQNLTGPEGIVNLGVGTGYTEHITITLTSTRGWAEIIGVDNVGNLALLPGNQAATFELGPGDAANVVVEVSVPPGTFASVPDDDGTKDLARLTYQAWQCPGGPILQGMSPVAETWVAEDRDFIIAPDNFGAALPGQTVTYTHVLTNIGNITDTYTLYPGAGFYASGEIAQPSPPFVTLAPWQTATLVISVTINPEAAGGLTDVTSAIARSTSGLERAAGNNTAISYTTGIRYVDVNGGHDSLVDETEGNPDPDAVDYLDNNCTQPDVAACRTIQHALSQAADWDEIRIAEGTYSDVFTTTHASQVITQVAFVARPVDLRGGYDPPDWDAEPPAHATHPTLLDPQGQGRAIFVTAGVSVTLDRLVLVNGDARGLGGGPGNADAGGNVYNEGADLTLTAARIADGTATFGGGLYSEGGELLLRNSLFHGDQASAQGGAVYVTTGTVTLEHNTFYNNTAGQEGGAVHVEDGALVVTNTIFAGSNSGSGGAVYGTFATAALDYNLYHANTGGDTGGTVPAPSVPNDVLADPQFLAPGTSPPDLHIAKTSPAKDVGLDIGVDIDYENSERPLGLGFDIGAYERVPVRGLLFYSDNTTDTLAGATIFFTHTLGNTGDTTDTITIDAGNSLDWPIELDEPIPYQITLAPGISQTLGVTISVPSDANGLTSVTAITATTSPPAISEVVLDTVHARSAAWQIGKTVTPLAVEAGDRLTYTLTITNVGDLDSSGTYTITDPLPQHTHFVSADPAPDTTDPEVTWVFDTPVAAGGGNVSVSFVVSVTRPLTDGTTIVNESYNVTGGGAREPAVGPPVSVLVSSLADLRIAKTAGVGPVRPGDWITYTITLTNASSASGPAHGVAVHDTLPGQVVYQSMGFVPPATGWINDSGSPNLTWQLDGGIPVGGSIQVTVTGRVASPLAAGTPLTNTCSATADNAPLEAQGELVTLVTSTNAITLSKTVEPAVVATGGAVTYTITLTNSGDGVADVTLTDLLAPGFTPPSYSTGVVVPGRTWTTTHGVTTVSFVATAPASPGLYANERVTATYDLSEVVIANTAALTAVVPVTGLSLTSDSPTEIGDTTNLTATLTAGTDVSFVLNYGDGSPLVMGTLVPGTPLPIAHTYATTGTFTAIITASNALGSQRAETAVLVVDEFLPDLVIADMWIEPPMLQPGRPITISVVVRNQGYSSTVIWSDPSSSWFWVEVYAKGSGFVPAGPPVDVFDHAGGSAGERWEYVTSSMGLAPQQEETLHYTIVLTDTSAYSLYAQVDVSWAGYDPPYGQPFGMIREMDETNNIYEFGALEPGHPVFLPLILRQG